MDPPKSDKDAGNEPQTPESKAFEDALRQIVKVPKKEIERRETIATRKPKRT